jgi:hypothetical protein
MERTKAKKSSTVENRVDERSIKEVEFRRPIKELAEPNFI